MFRDGEIDGVVVMEAERHEDSRGWLIELFREDELPGDHRVTMAYVSETLPGIARGPHEHREQSDFFVFMGPGDLRLYLWDSRPESATHMCRQVVEVGESNRRAVRVPPGVVHAYKNVGSVPAIVFNAPDRLYAGRQRSEPVDEIRHEDQVDSIYVLD